MGGQRQELSPTAPQPSLSFHWPCGDPPVPTPGKEPGLFDLIIVNDNLDKAYWALKEALSEVGSNRGQGCISVQERAWDRGWGSGQTPLPLSCRKSRRLKGLAALEDANSCVLPGQDPAPTLVARVSLARWLCLPLSPCSPCLFLGAPGQSHSPVGVGLVS